MQQYSYALYRQYGEQLVGHYDQEFNVMTRLFTEQGESINSLYQLVTENPRLETGEELDADQFELLAPFPERNIIAIGKNYREHAKEFNKSGFDSSDNTDIPSQPVVFTKNRSCIVPHGAPVYTHPQLTSTLDYEGEIAVIIGKKATKVSKDEAMDYVWGYTIVNDVTARELQRDHKQFFIGKSLDTFGPMGPVAKHKDWLHENQGDLVLETWVNGEIRQKGSLDDLIFPIPTLIETLSAGITLYPGDVIATGTPAGVGIGFSTPKYLKSGDTVEVKVSGIGSLKNVMTDDVLTETLLEYV